MTKAAPVEKCEKCGHQVTAVFVPGGGTPEYAPLWRFICSCGRQWERLQK